MKLWKKILLGGISIAVAFAAGLIAACSSDVETSVVFVSYEGQTLTLSGESGSEIELPVVEREGYVFKGWYATEDYSGDAISGAIFEKDATYYAKWEKSYEINFDLGGGQLSSDKKLYIEKDANIAAAVQDYVPTYGDLQFSGWYYNGEELNEREKMPASDITLTARYKAEYTIDVYLQDLDDTESYTKVSAYDTGYYLVGEEYSPELSIKGYEFDSLHDDKTELTISSDKSKNVFEFYFNRNSYILVYNVTYPDNTVDVKNEGSYLFEEVIEIADFMFAEVEGYRFLGWATTLNADPSDVIKEDTYKITDDTIFYAVWSKGYTDLFGGNDYIFLNNDEEGTAILHRGGIDIIGYYNEKKGIYVFEGDEILLNVKINANGTFVYYSNRKGSYILFDNRYIYPDVVISISDTDECSYSSSEADNKFYKSGTYVVDEDGIYTATVVDSVSGEEMTLYFTVGTVKDNNGTQYNVFMLRGDEYNYGVMPQYYDGDLYYPLITLDGFGYALLQKSNDPTDSDNYYYQIEDNIVYISSDGYNLDATIRIKEYNGEYVYEFYDKELDAQFVNGNAVLNLDGCSSAYYENGNTRIEGTYYYSTSLIGKYIITLKSGKDYYVFLIDDEGNFEEKNPNYAEYFNYNAASTSYGTTPYLVIEGDGTASIYEIKNSVPTIVSSGTITKSPDGLGYVYTVTGSVADWAEMQATTFTFMIDNTSVSYPLYYLLSSQTGSESPISYVTGYTSEDGGTLLLTDYFAIYQDVSGSTFSGLVTVYTDYIKVSNGSTNQYFTLTVAENSFVKLANAPMDLYMVDQDGKIQRNCKITINGTAIDDDKYYAVYTETVDGEIVKYEGYYVPTVITSMGSSIYVYIFESNDGLKTFKFIVTSNSSNYYFFYYELEEAIKFTEYEVWTDSDEEDETSTIIVTDLQEDGKPVIIYTVNGVSMLGTCTSENVSAFDLYDVEVYTFTSNDGSVIVKFTLLDEYFRLCSETVTYTSQDGSVLILDGATHIARYTVDYVDYDNYYQVVTNLLNENEMAVAIYMADEATYRYFDLDSKSKMFTVRGTEAGAYYIVDNDRLNGELVVLDGYGKAKIYDITSDSDNYKVATYSISDGLINLNYDGKTLVGQLGVNVYSEKSYNVFIIRLDVIVGTFFNEDNLSVMVLDGLNGATYYGSYGSVEYGTYTIVSDSLFYFTTGNRSGMALFKYKYNKDGVGTFSAIGRDETYYANDFSSIIFSNGGFVTIDNSAVYLYEETDGGVRLYEYGGKNSNAYGFSSFTISIDNNDKITYNGKIYSYFYGGSYALTDMDGNELTFQPTGEPTFSVSATFTDKETGTKSTYYVIVDYNDYDEVITILGCNKAIYLNSSIMSYNFTFNYGITFDLVAGTFELNEDDTICALKAYDYMWAFYAYNYGYPIDEIYGDISIYGEVVDGKMEYSVSGQFNYIVDEYDNILPVTFENGALSRAGEYDEDFGNLFITEFLGDDGETYHMSFYIYEMDSNLISYIVYSLTRVTDSFEMNDGSIIYSEELVYTLFNLPKYDEEGNPQYDEEGEVVTFEIGDEFYPSLRYKGELICSSNFEDLGNNEWLFISYVYDITEDGKYYIPNIHYYYFNYLTDELTGEILSGIVTKRLQAQYYTEDKTYSVYVLYNEEDSSIYEIFAITVNGNGEVATECVKNADGTFTVTTASGKYTVAFSTETDDDGNTVTKVTVSENELQENDK